MGGVVDAVFGGAPDAPDPYATAAAQGQANTEAARVTAALNRANQYTPWGSQTWQKGGTWDQAGYDAALQKYNTQLSDYNKAASTNPYQGSSGGLNGIFGQLFTASSSGLTAPTREDYGYNPDAWSSTTTLSPEQQQLLDQQNSISLGLGGAQEAALSRVQSSMGSGIDYSKLAGTMSAEDAFTTAAKHLYNPQGLYSQAEGLAKTAVAPVGQAAANFQQQLGSAMPGVERLGPGPQYQGVAGQAPTSDEAYRQQIQNALYSQQQSRLDPRFQQSESDLNSRLAAQGITQGSEAYNREVQNLGRERTDAYQQAMNQSIAGGEAAIAGQYGRDLSGRQQNVGETNLAYQNALAGRQQDLGALDQYFSQGLAQRQQGMNEYNTALSGALGAQAGQIGAGQYGLQYGAAIPDIAQGYSNVTSSIRNQQLAEQLQQRSTALNELNALRSGAQVSTPQFGSTQSGASVGAAPIADSIMNAYGQQNAAYGSAMGGLTSLGSAAMMAPAGTFAGLGSALAAI